MGRIYLKKGCFQIAKDKLTKSRDILTRCYGNENNIQIAIIYGLLGELYESTHQNKEAWANYD